MPPFRGGSRQGRLRPAGSGQGRSGQGRSGQGNSVNIRPMRRNLLTSEELRCSCRGLAEELRSGRRRVLARSRPRRCGQMRLRGRRQAGRCRQSQARPIPTRSRHPLPPFQHVELSGVSSLAEGSLRSVRMLAPPDAGREVNCARYHRRIPDHGDENVFSSGLAATPELIYCSP